MIKDGYLYENEEIRCATTLEKVGDYFIIDNVMFPAMLVFFVAAKVLNN